MSPHQKKGGAMKAGQSLSWRWSGSTSVSCVMSSPLQGMAWHAPARQLLNFTTALWPVACANCTTVQLHEVDLRTFKGGGQEWELILLGIVITKSIIIINSNVLRITIKKMFDSDESSLTMIVTLFNSVCDDTREEIFWQEKISWSCKLEWIALFRLVSRLLKRPKNLQMRKNAQRWAKATGLQLKLTFQLWHQDHILAFIGWVEKRVLFKHAGQCLYSTNQTVETRTALMVHVWGLSRKWWLYQDHIDTLVFGTWCSHTKWCSITLSVVHVLCEVCRESVGCRAGPGPYPTKERSSPDHY